MKRLVEITIADLMPDSISGDAQVSAISRAIDPQLRLISEAVDKPLILAAIDDLSAGVLEHLAVQYDITSWDSAWSIETKRVVLKTAIADKRKKGTRGAVERAIEAVAPIATLTEWWQDTSGDMPPHTFNIDLLQDGSAVDPEIQESVIAQVEEAKPARSHYIFRVGQLMGGDLCFSGVLRAISYARVRSAGTSAEQTSIDAGVLAALRGMSIRRLLASSHMGEMPEPTVVEQYRYGIMGTDSESADLIPFDESEFALMESTGIQQSYGEFVDDAGLNFVMSQNELMESTGIQQSYGEFVDDAGLSFVMSQNELMEIWEPPALPIVNTSNSNWLTTSTGREVTISANGTTDGYNYDGSSYYQESYDSTKAYAIRMWYDETPTLMGHSGISLVNQNGYVVIQNLLSVSTKFCQGYYATCSSNQATVVTVYDSSNNPYNAFQYTLDNTDYYYVLDGTQADWTDDLSSIGYSLTPAQTLPTVTVDDTFYGLISGVANINPGSSSDALRAWNGSSFTGQTIVRDSSCAYAFRKYSDGNGLLNPCGKFVVDWYIDPWYPDSEQICAKNPNAAAQPFYSAKVATCSSSDATLITVYNTSNEAFNAFKYTLDGVDYYYVLDGTQDDWTDDLSSIGYHLPPEYEELTLYLQSGSSKNMQFSATSATTTISKGGYSGDVVYQLYTDSGRSVAFTPDLTKIYRIGYYDGTEWKELKYQSIDSMPETVTSNLSDSVSCFIILNSGMMWFLTNLNRTITSPSYEVNIRAYPDNREWTQETLYEEQTTIYHQNNCTCYTSPIPSGGTYKSKLYRDAARTNRFYYDLDKDYRRVYESNGELVIAQRQTIFDMPTTTGVVAYAIIILKTGEEWCVKSQSGSSSFQGSTITIQSAPKQYDEPTITLDLGLKVDLSSATFSSNDYWFSVLRNPLDKQKAIDFGVDIVQGEGGGYRISATIMDHFNVELVALCDAYENTVTTDMSNFYIAASSNGTIYIRSNQAYNTATNYWRVRITKKTT